MAEALLQAVGAGLIGIYFTHRIFVRFILGFFEAQSAVANGKRFELSEGQLLLHALQIAAGLIPLGFAVVRFVDVVWSMDT